MVKEKHTDWEELLRNFPCEILREIDRLWLVYSENKFGISLQAEIYQSIQINDDIEKWSDFVYHVGWRTIIGIWKSLEGVYDSIQCNEEEWRWLTRFPPSLPVLIYVRNLIPVIHPFWLAFSSLAQRFVACKTEYF